MIINGLRLFQLAPIKNMIAEKRVVNGRSYGLSEVGYDIRLKQTVLFSRDINTISVDGVMTQGNFCLASSVEEFDMPDNLVGVVHDKSTNVRKGVQVFNTIIEPGWKGFLTLEIAFHGSGLVLLEVGTPIAQVIFHEVLEPARYSGKYQNQKDEPVGAIYD